MEQATKHLKAEPALKPEEYDPFINWCDLESLRAFIELDNQEAGEFLRRCSMELLAWLRVYADDVLLYTDEELMQRVNEQGKETILKFKGEIEEWRSCHTNHAPIPLSFWLRSKDKERQRLAQHFDQQIADFRVLRKAGLLSGKGSV
jgi:hypothetical protein